MAVLFRQLAKGTVNQQPLLICRRAIAVIESAENIAWFDFHEHCAMAQDRRWTTLN